jgi:hypothetical protein
VNVDLAPSARVVEPRPPLHHAPARSRDAAILAQLAAGWCTLLEIAEPCNLPRPEAYAIVRRLARERTGVSPHAPVGQIQTLRVSRLPAGAQREGGRIMKCGWWNRWLHRRLRNADVLFLLPALRLRAEMGARTEHEIEQLIDQGFQLHASMPGQEHWRCECARQESPLAALAKP